MKKSLLFLGVLSLGLAHAQQDLNGKVGINIDQPKATFDIAAHKQDGTTKEGILIPRFEKAKVVAMTNAYRTTLVESTLLYVTDEVTDADKAIFEGTGKGFYYFDKKGQTTADATARWVKVGSGAAAASEKFDMNKATGKVQMLPVPISGNQVDADTFLLIGTPGGAYQVDLPAPPNNGEEIRILMINGQAGSDLQFVGNNAPVNLGTVTNGAGHTLIGYKGKWYVGGGAF